jgi:hypothetical protein
MLNIETYFCWHILLIILHVQYSDILEVDNDSEDSEKNSGIAPNLLVTGEGPVMEELLGPCCPAAVAVPCCVAPTSVRLRSPAVRLSSGPTWTFCYSPPALAGVMHLGDRLPLKEVFRKSQPRWQVGSQYWCYQIGSFFRYLCGKKF